MTVPAKKNPFTAADRARLVAIRTKPTEPVQVDLRRIEPGARIPGESGKAFYAFGLYRDAGPLSRRVADVAKQVGRSEPLMNRWCRRWRWYERARMFDDYEDAKRRERNRERWDTIGDGLLAKVAMKVGPADKGGLKPEEIGAHATARMAMVGATLHGVIPRGGLDEDADEPRGAAVHVDRTVIVHEERSLTVRILADPESARLLLALEDRLAGSPAPDGPGAAPEGVGGNDEPGSVEAGEAPGGREPVAD